MNLEHLTHAFARLGARVRFGEGQLNVLSDQQGEFFLLNLDQARNDGYNAVDVQPRRRHLVLLSHTADVKERFLCGHDERHWFVAGVPSQGPATVEAAMDALQPPVAREAQMQAGVRHRRRHRRHNAGFLRQGEWFFVPHPDFEPEHGWTILRNEPLQRGGGKPHMAEHLCRVGGETVHVSRMHPNGLTAAQLAEFRRENPELFKQLSWRVMQRDPITYVKGRVRHPDHATIELSCWHRVAVNRETRSQALAFLD